MNNEIVNLTAEEQEEFRKDMVGTIKRLVGDIREYEARVMYPLWRFGLSDLSTELDAEEMEVFERMFEQRFADFEISDDGIQLRSEV